ncbi:MULTISPECIES: IS21-like element helper ATPase IstB [Flavobacterium]|uniref:IS21-like element helper ATPase IstB n=1 Tax=Flavobacterium lipolyticum TaxID=2893754 RepID=A0ABS8M6N7_9FLAO|nr:IS21-like element helper ATPase IstB [Flavobacterium sp. F-126]MCC9020488.1 IS21-like element helper ATPase IstB [Flavobacterium sp. F-126]
MKQLKLYGMSRAFNTTLKASTIDELITYLINSEYDDRENRKVERLINIAKFRYKAFMEEIDFDSSRRVEKNLINRLEFYDFIKNKQNFLICGSTGFGKSFIATAIGYKACMMGYKVMYFNINKLFSKLKMAKADGSYIKEINKIEKQDLIILDDFGLQSLDNLKRQDLMVIIEDRHGKKSTIIASQFPVESWHEVITEQTIADAILDRIVHNALRIELKGESMRKKKIDKQS